MNIVMLNGQNHQGSTYRIGRMIADKISGDNELREFFFPKDLNHFCMGCYRCIEDEKACPYYEEKKVILDAIEEADVLIATTPTYCKSDSNPLEKRIPKSRYHRQSYLQSFDLCDRYFLYGSVRSALQFSFFIHYPFNTIFLYKGLSVRKIVCP